MTQPTEIIPRSWIMIALLGFVWGTSFLFISIAIREHGPLTVAAGRLTVAALCLLLFIRVTGRCLPDIHPPNGKTIWGAALAMGLLSNAIPFTLLSWAQGYVASGFAGVSMAVVPLMILPLAHFLVPGEHMTWRETFGFILGFAGVVLLIGPEALQRLGGDWESTARVVCISASLCYACGAIVTRLCPPVNAIPLAAATLICAALSILPVAMFVEGWPQFSWSLPTLAILYLGVLPTALAQLLLVMVTREAGPGFFGLTNYQVPVWSFILGAVFLGEELPPSLLLALLLILSGVALSQFPALRRLFART